MAAGMFLHKGRVGRPGVPVVWGTGYRHPRACSSVHSGSPFPPVSFYTLQKGLEVSYPPGPVTLPATAGFGSD